MDLDDATRARLRAEWQARKDAGRTAALVLLDEGLALLAAYDELVGDATDLAERCAAVQGERDQANALAETWAAKWADTQARYIAAELRAAPVLAAAEAWADNLFLTDTGVVDLERTLRAAIAAWRAARGETP